MNVAENHYTNKYQLTKSVKTVNFQFPLTYNNACGSNIILIDIRTHYSNKCG